MCVAWQIPMLGIYICIHMFYTRSYIELHRLDAVPAPSLVFDFQAGTHQSPAALPASARWILISAAQLSVRSGVYIFMSTWRCEAAALDIIPTCPEPWRLAYTALQILRRASPRTSSE